MTPALRALLLSTFALTACQGAGVDDEPIPESALVHGLELRGGDFGIPDDHLVEVVVHEGYVYIANSNVGYAVMRLDDDGGLTTTDRGYEYEANIRCTTLAVSRRVAGRGPP